MVVVDVVEVITVDCSSPDFQLNFQVPAYGCFPSAAAGSKWNSNFGDRTIDTYGKGFDIETIELSGPPPVGAFGAPSRERAFEAPLPWEPSGL